MTLVERDGRLEGFVEHSGKRWAIEVEPSGGPTSYGLVLPRAKHAFATTSAKSFLIRVIRG